MKPLKGDEAAQDTKALFARVDAERAKILADAMAEAARNGKEPFNIEIIKTHWVLKRPPREYPNEQEYADLEFDYYNSSAQTNIEFAERLSEFEYWR